MKLKYFKLTAISFILFVFATSCQNKGIEFPKAPEQVFLTEEIMPPIEYFTLEKLEIPEAAQISESYGLYADTLLFVFKCKKPSPYILSFYNLKTNELVAGYFTKGRAAGEMLSALYMLRNNGLFVADVSQNKSTFMNVDSIALLRYDYTPKIIQTEDCCMEGIRCVNDTLIGINSYHFYGFGYEHVPEFFKTSCADGKFPVDCFPKKMIGAGPMNVNQRLSCFNEHTKQYVVAWMNYPYINIYDEDFNLQKQFIGPDTYMQNLVEYEFGLFRDDSTSSEYYTGFTQTDNYIFYVNYRKNGNDSDWMPDDAETYCFDKSLNLVRRLKKKESSQEHLLLLYPSYSEETGNLYFEVQNNDNGELELYKCVFE